MTTRRNAIRLFAALPVLGVAGRFPVYAEPVKTKGVVHDIDIAVFQFQPQKIEIRAGDTVRWTNRDGIEHSATAEDTGPDAKPLFDTGLFERDEFREITFEEPGTYPYFCARHPSMQGSLVVTD